jgi:glutathione S-transferase
MKLYGSTRSPFTRKVLVAARELELLERLEFIPVVVSQTQTDPKLVQVHPLGQIPALLLDDRRLIHDSLVICEFLDRLAGGALVPTGGDARWDVLSKHALGQGLLETLVKLFGERKRVADPLQPIYSEAFTRKFFRALPTLDAQYRRQTNSFDLGDISVCCALSYADFRFPQQDWRQAHPSLAVYYEKVAQRPSMQATRFVGDPTPTPALQP